MPTFTYEEGKERIWKALNTKINKRNYLYIKRLMTTMKTRNPKATTFISKVYIRTSRVKNKRQHNTYTHHTNYSSVQKILCCCVLDLSTYFISADWEQPVRLSFNGIIVNPSPLWSIPCEISLFSPNESFFLYWEVLDLRGD